MATYYISDLHLCHEKMLEPRGFKTLEEMHSRIVEGWNSVVKFGDTVIVAGDVCMLGSDPQKWAENYVICRDVFKRLRVGRWLLVGGNHDHGDMRQSLYRLYFDKIYGAFSPQSDVLVTHIPIHPAQLERWEFNIHGHTHTNFVQREREVDTGTGPMWINENDPNYWNVSCEALNYVPHTLAQLEKKYLSQ